MVLNPLGEESDDDDEEEEVKAVEIQKPPVTPTQSDPKEKIKAKKSEEVQEPKVSEGKAEGSGPDGIETPRTPRTPRESVHVREPSTQTVDEVAKEQKMAAVKIQSHFRGHRTKIAYHQKKKSAIKIQSMIRVHLAKKHHPEVKSKIAQVRFRFSRRSRAAVVIQRWFRMTRDIDESKVRNSMNIIIQDHEYALSPCSNSSIENIDQSLFSPHSYRTSVVKELLATEETYVKDLDTTIIVRPLLHQCIQKTKKKKERKS